MTSVTAVPLVLTRLSKDEIVESFDLSSLKEIFSAAAPLSADVEKTVVEKLNVKVLQGRTYVYNIKLIAYNFFFTLM